MAYNLSKLDINFVKNLLADPNLDLDPSIFVRPKLGCRYVQPVEC